MSGAISYLPKPFDDLAKIWSVDPKSRSLQMEAKEKKIVIRLSLVAMKFFLCYQAGFSLPAVTSLGFVCSLPSTALFVGIYLFELACKKAFENILHAGAYAAISWLCLSVHEERTWGFVERFFPGPRPVIIPLPEPPSDQDWIAKPAYVSYVPQGSLIKQLRETWNEKGKFLELQEADEEESGIFSYKSLPSKLNTEDVIEFFYCYSDIRLNLGNARHQGIQRTGRNQQQVFYGCFSNTFSKSFMCEGIEWASREHYIQARRFKEGSRAHTLIKCAEGSFSTTQGLLREVAKPEYAVDLRGSDWEQESFYVALHANFAFFAQHKEYRDLLIATENVPLVQRNDRHDIWGISYRDGTSKLVDADGVPMNRNRQGWILMYLRNYFRN
ncbi:NADAR family protein [Simkania sp.]|uniref:NADAR family protein n=1 Tax=Simkania sp. TaxID=34094 RepID=UPI003B51A66A